MVFKISLPLKYVFAISPQGKATELLSKGVFAKEVYLFISPLVIDGQHSGAEVTCFPWN